jgi:7-cyano-7-deazaguanine synthase
MQVALFSGGMDSTAMLAQLAREGDVTALSFIYGSKHNAAESEAADEIADLLDVPRHVIVLDFNEWGFKSDLLTSGGDIPEGHYADESMKATVVPFRNGIMLSIAVGFAESIGAEAVYIASHAGDHAIYPDCRPEFTDAISQAAQLGTYAGIKIINPFRNTDKTGIVRQAQARGDLPIVGDSWSCYQPTEGKHCGRCGTCVERKEAFAGAGAKDPTGYAV